MIELGSCEFGPNAISPPVVVPFGEHPRILWSELTNASRVDICKQHAAECDRHALLSADEDIRRQYVDLARQWRDMADTLEEMADMLEEIERLQRSAKIG